MNIKIDNRELLSLVHIDVDTDKLAEILRAKMGEELSEAICENTKSFIDAEKILGPDCTITIRNGESIVVILRDGEKEKEFIIHSNPLLYLLYSVYYLSNINQVTRVDNNIRVEYGRGWIDEEEKEKEA